MSASAEPVEPIEPLRLAFDVACPPDHAFMVWTERIATWWPADHTASGEPNQQVVLEGRIGGRIFERTTAGDVHEWGEVIAWEPPHRLVYLCAGTEPMRPRSRSASSQRATPRGSRSSTAAGNGWERKASPGATATWAAGARCSPISFGRPRKPPRTEENHRWQQAPARRTIPGS